MNPAADSSNEGFQFLALFELLFCVLVGMK